MSAFFRPFYLLFGVQTLYGSICMICLCWPGRSLFCQFWIFGVRQLHERRYFCSSVQCTIAQQALQAQGSLESIQEQSPRNVWSRHLRKWENRYDVLPCLRDHYPCALTIPPSLSASSHRFDIAQAALLPKLPEAWGGDTGQEYSALPLSSQVPPSPIHFQSSQSENQECSALPCICLGLHCNVCAMSSWRENPTNSCLTLLWFLRGVAVVTQPLYEVKSVPGEHHLESEPLTSRSHCPSIIVLAQFCWRPNTQQLSVYCGNSKVTSRLWAAASL